MTTLHASGPDLILSQTLVKFHGDISPFAADSGRNLSVIDESLGTYYWLTASWRLCLGTM